VINIFPLFIYKLHQHRPHTESNLIGAEISCHTPLPNVLLHGGVQSIKTYPMSTLDRSHRKNDLIGAKLSVRVPRHGDSTYISHPFRRSLDNTRNPSISNGGRRYTKDDLVGAQISFLANAGNYPIPSTSNGGRRYTKDDLVGAQISFLANAGNYPIPSTSNGDYTEGGDLVGARMTRRNN